MELETGWIEIVTPSGACSAFRARPLPVPGRLPGILVIQEVWGVDGHIQDLVLRFATAGYLALAPDLYTVGARPGELAPDRIAAVKAFLERVPPAVWTDPEERSKALALLPAEEGRKVAATMDGLFGRRDPEGQLRTLVHAVGSLRDDPAVNGHAGCVGFCMGGNLSARLAARDPALSAAVVFYGSPPPPEEIPAIRCPVLGFYGGDDARITLAVPAFAESMQAAGGSFEQHVYAGAPHAFFNDTRRSYHPAAARDAWARCLLFFAAHVSPVAS